MSSASTMKLVKAALERDVPVLLWGPPGTGKTAAITAHARKIGAHLEVLIGSTMDPRDVGGLMVPDVNGRIQVNPPPWALAIKRALEAKRPAWLFLDELSCAPGAVQAPLLRVIQERQVAGLDLTGCRILGAANPADSAVDGGWLGPAMANRMGHLTMNVDATSWANGELSNWGAPRPRDEAPVAGAVCGFIRKNPKALLDFPEDRDKAGLAWPSPRAWSQAIRLMTAVGWPDARELPEGLGSLVGGGAAQEFFAWLRAQDLPDPEALLAGKATLPTRGDQLAVALDALAAAALADRDDRAERCARAWDIITGTRPDIAVGPAAALIDGGEAIPDVGIELGEKIRRLRMGG